MKLHVITVGQTFVCGMIIGSFFPGLLFVVFDDLCFALIWPLQLTGC